MIEFTSRFRKIVRQFPKQLRSEIGQAIDEVQNSIGKPHQHSGISVRRLSNHLFECRVGLNLRLIFTKSNSTLIFQFAGNHDEVKKFIKDR